MSSLIVETGLLHGARAASVPLGGRNGAYTHTRTRTHTSDTHLHTRTQTYTCAMHVATALTVSQDWRGAFVDMWKRGVRHLRMQVYNRERHSLEFRYSTNKHTQCTHTMHTQHTQHTTHTRPHETHCACTTAALIRQHAAPPLT